MKNTDNIMKRKTENMYTINTFRATVLLFYRTINVIKHAVEKRKKEQKKTEKSR
ncbi:hypothetical protein WN51_10294 [Melipona quadrifasciata]|uniref:Uncharacterized protein n=1 Tax=Melipona quadrifasciata TaxID=166423 RepID=A0A0N0BI44_9HYME|nr:hypothetical protein WN51_10294 [Melipona quadrifasciata]